MRLKLPEKVIFYCRQIDKDGVQQTFPVNPESEARHATAQQWAQSSHYTGHGTSKNLYKVFEYDNANFDDVTIKNLEHHNEKGRFYQVIINKDHNKFQVNFRENVLMDVIENTGIQAGGRLNGTFAFILNESQFYLVREQSDAWKVAEENTKQVKNIPNNLRKKDLKVGYIYENLSGSRYIYLGDVYVRKIGLNNGVIKITKPERQILTFELRGYGTTPMQDFNDFVNYGNFEKYIYKLHMFKSQLFKFEREQVTQLTTDEFLKIIKDGAQKTYDMYINSNYQYDQYRRSNLLFQMYKYLDLSLTRQAAADQVKIDEITKVIGKYFYNKGRA